MATIASGIVLTAISMYVSFSDVGQERYLPTAVNALATFAVLLVAYSVLRDAGENAYHALIREMSK